MTDYLVRDTYLPLLNDKFSISFDAANRAEAELIEVSELISRPPQEQFSIVFLLPDSFPVLQRLCEIEHPKLGKYELFLVPVGKTDAATKFEAVINRLVKED